MFEFLIFMSLPLVVAFFWLPQLQMSATRRQAMLQLAIDTGADFPDTEIPQDFPFSLTDDLNWGNARNCIFWRSPSTYIVVMDVQIGFGKQTRPLTLLAAKYDASNGIVWSLPRGIEMRSEEGWVVLLKRRRYLRLSALISIPQIKQLHELLQR